MGHTTKGNEEMRKTKEMESVGSGRETRWKRVAWILMERSGLAGGGKECEDGRL